MSSSALLQMHSELTRVRYEVEKAEVLLKNLMALRNKEQPGFMIDDEDVAVTLQTAVGILEDIVMI